MPDELAFLKAILEKPDDDARKLVYADWLEEQGDPRAEYLRLMVGFRQQRVVTPELRQRYREFSAELVALETRRDGLRSERRRRVQALEQELAEVSKQCRQEVPARLQELAATLDANWLAAVSSPEIDHCGQNAGNWWQLRFQLVCDKTWADMQPTNDTNVRHCDACKKNVHYCDNLADAREHAVENHCIAVDLGVIRRDGDLRPRMMIAGQPSRADLRRCYEDDVDPVSQARLDARKRGSGGA